MDKPLSHKRQAFVEEYCVNGHNATQAYGKAYPDCQKEGWDGHGARLVGIGSVSIAIVALDAELKAKHVKSRQERQNWWSQTMDEAPNYSDRLRASELLGRSEADFTDKVQTLPDADALSESDREALAPLIREAKLRLSKSMPDKELKIG